MFIFCTALKILTCFSQQWFQDVKNEIQIEEAEASQISFLQIHKSESQLKIEECVLTS